MLSLTDIKSFKAITAVVEKYIKGETKTGSVWYMEFNNYHRGLEHEWQQDFISATKTLDLLIEMSEVEEDLIVYRTVTKAAYNALKANDFVEKSFASTSLLPWCFKEKEGNVLLKIKLTKGDKAFNIGGEAKEILLGRGEKLNVIGFTE